MEEEFEPKNVSISNGMIGDEQAVFVRQLKRKGYSYGLIVRLAIDALPLSGSVGYKHNGYMTRRIADTLVTPEEKEKLDRYCSRNNVSISQGVRDGLYLLSQSGLVRDVNEPIKEVQVTENATV
jgi:hypothetical protein